MLSKNPATNTENSAQSRSEHIFMKLTLFVYNINSQYFCVNIKRDFYYDVYTIFNRIKLTIWTICAFRVLNPHQWSLAKEVISKVKKICPKRAKTS